MIARNSELESLLSNEKMYQKLISEVRNKKLLIYADIIFAVDNYDFFDFMTGYMGYSLGFLAYMLAISTPESCINACCDPADLANSATVVAGTALFFFASHLLYRYSTYDSYLLESANKSLKKYSEIQSRAFNNRISLFPESNKSFFTSAVESARKFIGI